MESDASDIENSQGACSVRWRGGTCLNATGAVGLSSREPSQSVIKFPRKLVYKH